MGYVKIVKNKSYYKRFQVRFRRRRACVTNYRLRRNLIRQDKRKYNAPKWRLVVRFTNKDVIAQVVSAKLIGDHVLSAAYAHELKRYGLGVGLTNYSACYCTGLLIARRLLKKLKLDQKYPGKKSLDGNRFRSRVTNVHWKPGEKLYRPFKCILDTGLARCTTGARVFAVLKGAVDGGLDIPHSVNRFPGFTRGKGEEGKDVYKADVHRAKIFGEHVSEYMKKLETDNQDKYNKQFSQYIKDGITADGLEDVYHKIHRAIRKNPTGPARVKKDWKTMDIRKKQPRMAKEDKERIKGAEIARRKPTEPLVVAPLQEDKDIDMGATE